MASTNHSDQTSGLQLDLLTIFNGEVGGNQRLPIRDFPMFERHQQTPADSGSEPLFQKGGHLSGKYLSEKLTQCLRSGTVQLVNKDGKLRFEIRFEPNDRSPVLDEYQTSQLLDAIRLQNFGIAEVYANGGDANLVITPLGNKRVGSKPKVRLVVKNGRLGIEFPTSLQQ